MEICPHCLGEFDGEKKYISCPHCRRTPKTVDQCVKALLDSGQLENLLQKATDEYWEIITTGLRHIVIMDKQTCLEVCEKLFSLPEDI